MKKESPEAEAAAVQQLSSGEFVRSTENSLHKAEARNSLPYI